MLISSCVDQGNQDGTSEITIQKYSFDFPKDYRKVRRKTFNSYMGQISNDTITFDFHFSNHVRPPVKSLTQFFDDEEWKPTVLLDIVTKKNISDIGSINFLTPRKATERDSSIGDGCDYIVKCKFDSLEFEMPIFLPEKMKGINISSDTIFGQYRETYTSGNPRNGITGIFIRTIPKNRRDSLQADALSLITTNLTKSQQIEVLKILSTFRIKGTD